MRRPPPSHPPPSPHRRSRQQLQTAELQREQALRDEGTAAEDALLLAKLLDQPEEELWLLGPEDREGAEEQMPVEYASRRSGG